MSVSPLLLFNALLFFPLNSSSKPTQYHEKLRPGQAQMICASFSPGGIFLAAGSADHHVRVYLMADDGPKRILEIESHTDTVDSIQWAHNGLKFVSGSKDGTALLWQFESSQWKFQKLLMTDRLPTCPAPDDENKKLKVTMVSWDYSDQWVVTAVIDHTVSKLFALSEKYFTDCNKYCCCSIADQSVECKNSKITQSFTRSHR